MTGDIWRKSEIQEQFTLPVQRVWLADEMLRLCKKLVAKNRAYINQGTYRVFAIPEVDHEDDRTTLTWGYAILNSNADNSCIQWRLKDADAEVIVEGFCFEQLFAVAFYQLIEVARIATQRATPAPASSAATVDQVTPAGGSSGAGSDDPAMMLTETLSNLPRGTPAYWETVRTWYADNETKYRLSKTWLASTLSYSYSHITKQV